MTEDQLHELMDQWMNADISVRALSGMNKPPKLLRRQWRIGQLKRIKRQKRRKTTKAAKTEMDDLVKRAAAETDTTQNRTWRSKMYSDM